MKISDEDVLTLHVDQDGVVWFADGDRTPIRSGADVAEFTATIAQRSPLFVRALGTHQNAVLIGKLYPWCSTSGGQIEVATPRLCRSATELLTPEMALLRSRMSRLPPVLGGWHEVTAVEYPTYALISALAETQRYDDRIEYLLMRHPLWHDLQFIYDVQAEWAAWMIAFIIDPRWHVDRQHPDRVRRLCNFMGLSPRVQRRLGGQLTRAGKDARCHATLMTWKGGAIPEAAMLADDPGCFLHRIARACNGGCQGDLRASGKLMTYVRQTWLQNLAAGTRYSDRESLFAPNMYFKTQAEVAAFTAHAARRRGLFDSPQTHG